MLNAVYDDRMLSTLRVLLSISSPDVGPFARYQEMMKAAQDYYRVLDQAAEADPEEVQRLKLRLDELLEPYSDDAAFTAYLKIKREVAGLGGDNA